MCSVLLLLITTSTFALTDISYDSKQRVKSSIQGPKGFLWFGTNKGVFRYDGYKFKNLNDINPQKINKYLKQITVLHMDKNNHIWIGTHENGLYQHIGGQTRHIKLTNTVQSTNEIIYDIIHDHHSVWIATNYGLYRSNDSIIKHIKFPQRKQPYNIKSIINLSNDELIMTTGYDVLKFSKNDLSFNPVKLPEVLKEKFIWDIYKDKDKLWVATDLGVFFYNKNNQWQHFESTLINFPIRKIISNQTHIWFGSIANGLIQYNKKTDEIVHHLSELGNKKSLTSNQIFSLLLDRTNLLWVFLFNGEINTLDTFTENFGINADTINTECQIQNNVLAFAENKKTMWINSKHSVLKIDKINGGCNKISVYEDNTLAFDNETVLSSYLEESGTLWVGSSKGLHVIESNNEFFKAIPINEINKFINFIINYKESHLLLGTEDGLFKFNKSNHTHQRIPLNKTFANVQFHNFAVNKNNQLFFATSNGIYMLQDDKLYIYEAIQSQLPNKFINTIYIDNKNILWIGTAADGLFRFDFDQKTLKKMSLKNNINVKSIVSDLNQGLWFGTTEGLFLYNQKTHNLKWFMERDGLQDNYFNRGSNHINAKGQLYFGGLKGYNKFDPNQINTNTIAPKIELTSIKRFNNEVLPYVDNEGFMINQPIDQLKELTLTHKDYVMSFGFAALDFNDSSRNQYAYKLSGFDPKWSYVDANNRQVTYTNLPAGQYTLMIKGSNKNGVWSETPKTLEIRVLPAPWFSWWAISAYVLTLVYLIFYYVQRKIRANKKMAQLLRIEVKQKTKEIQKQKQTVESLLDKKNELFANVSHEFRTPLTLILGPINSLLKAHLPKHNIDEISMVKRNATRLLTLVEQLLQMAKISDNNLELVPQYAHIQIEKIVESFHYLASEKRIALNLIQNDPAAVNTTKLAVEIILSNLISNAIKYTQTGGIVDVTAIVESNQLSVTVKDSGCGLDDQQQIEIFKRFKRLDSHLSIEGVGIGLAVVKEVLDANGGKIHVESTLGEGSAFIFSLPVIPLEEVKETQESAHGLLKQLTRPDSLLIHEEEDQKIKLDSKKDCIVIIEDNKDMRTLIANTLSPYYHCILAKDGTQGVALAIKYIPDVIISDVMMPGMDGFKVSRMVRSDQRTSHIPLILLTALNDKTSRIKGWREHIDIYLTKPFDADELLLQLNNVITIRNILKRKANVSMQKKDKENLGLNKKDQDFINKLQVCIEDNFNDPLFTRTKLSSKMFMSERQLQRKLKALIDQNPMDMLREYRLKQAAIKLKNGHQVSIVTDMCGFNSLSHFSQCFKAHYGVSPKKYQQTCDPKNNN